MLKDLIPFAAFAAFGTAASAIEAWLDQRGFDRVSALFLWAFSLSLIVLIILLCLHFGRWL